jgi:RNA polymerase sigma-70 factor (ECF subfamily)
MPDSTANLARAGDQTARASDVDDATTALELSRLIGRVAAGEQAALGQLYDLTVGRLYALAQTVLRNAADAEEVVCEVYTQVWQSAAQYDRSRGGVMGWLLTICRSRAIDRSRRNRSRQQASTAFEATGAHRDNAAPNPEDLLTLVQQGTSIHRALEQLTPIRRELVSLAFFRGLSHEEIAIESKLPIGTVKSHIRRALATLRAELDRANQNKVNHDEGGDDVTASS